MQCLLYTFLKKFNDLGFLSSIRPRTTKGDPTCTHLVCIKYAGGMIQVKLKLFDQFTEFFRRISKPPGNVVHQFLHSKRPPLLAKQYKQLQEMKYVLLREVHRFYVELPLYSPQSSSKPCNSKICGCIIIVNNTYNTSLQVELYCGCITQVTQ